MIFTFVCKWFWVNRVMCSDIFNISIIFFKVVHIGWSIMEVQYLYEGLGLEGLASVTITLHEISF